MNLLDVYSTFKTDADCLAYLEKMRWPKGVRCVTCGSNKLSRITSSSEKQSIRKLFQCLEPTCRQQFTTTSGTIFHDTRLPLSKWFIAVALIVDAKKGMSAKQLQRHLKIGSYKTAWYMAHRIRKAMEESEGSLLGGTVEIDETYIGGKQHTYRKAGFGDSNKQVVLGIRQRGGDLRFFHAADAKAGTLAKYIRENISTDVEVIVTDELNAYPTALKTLGFTDRHNTIKHKSKVYVDGDIHTNTVENAFSLFKRGIVGSFHKISLKHLSRYLAEFQYRFNRRSSFALPGF